jgi:hypothetical protein
MVMQRLPGVTGSEAHKAWKDRRPLNVFHRQQRDAIYTAYATMILKHDCFQMDPHPGNFMAMPDGSIALLDFGQCCCLTRDQQQLVCAFVKNAPSSIVEASDSGRLQLWFGQLGITVTAKQALKAAGLLVLGDKSSMFPDVGGMDEQWTPIWIILLYLSRFENTAAELRNACGLVDKADNFAVLNAFKKVLQ